MIHLFTLLFVALKLTGLIEWSWWWVLAPSWGVFAIGLLGLAMQGAAWLLMNEQERARHRAIKALRNLVDAL